MIYLYSSMKKMTNFIYRMFKLPELVHELLHCLPAWYWGLNPKISEDWYRTRYQRTTDSRRLVIVLMPAFVGLLFLPLVWNMVIHKAMFHIAAAIFWVGWMGACGSDLYKAGYYLIFKKWIDRKDEQ